MPGRQWKYMGTETSSGQFCSKETKRCGSMFPPCNVRCWSPSVYNTSSAAKTNNNKNRYPNKLRSMMCILCYVDCVGDVYGRGINSCTMFTSFTCTFVLLPCKLVFAVNINNYIVTSHPLKHKIMSQFFPYLQLKYKYC